MFLSTIVTAAVAFAAYTSSNLINGNVEVVGNPYKVVFTDAEGNPVTSISPTRADEADATDISVINDGKDLSGFTVTTYHDDFAVKYETYVTNTGGTTAYLDSISVARAEAEDFPPLAYGVRIYRVGATGDTCVMRAVRGIATSLSANGGNSFSSWKPVSLGAGATVKVELELERFTVESLSNYSGSFTLGQVSINWTNVDPATTA